MNPLYRDAGRVVLVLGFVTVAGCYTQVKPAPRVEIENDPIPVRPVSAQVEMVPVTLRFGEAVQYDELTIRFDDVSDLRECRHDLDVAWSLPRLSHSVFNKAFAGMVLSLRDEEPVTWDLWTPSSDPYHREFVLGDYRVVFRCLMPIRIRYVSSEGVDDFEKPYPPGAYVVNLLVGHHDSPFAEQVHYDPSMNPCTYHGH